MERANILKEIIYRYLYGLYKVSTIMVKRNVITVKIKLKKTVSCIEVDSSIGRET